MSCNLSEKVQILKFPESMQSNCKKIEVCYWVKTIYF